MSTTLKPAYASAATITVTLTSLGSGSARQSAVVDNSTNLYDDALVSATIKTGTVSGTPTVSLYAYSLGDGGSYTDGCTGSDAAYTLVSPTNLRLLGVLNTPSNTTTYVSPEYSVALAFGGMLPQKWGLVVSNNSGAALDASVGSASYIGVNWQNV